MDIPKPKISPNFTVEDIRKLRDWDAERWENMTQAEIIADIHEGAKPMLKRLDEMRAARDNAMRQQTIAI